MYPKWQVHWDFIEISALVPLSFIGKNTVEGSVHTLFIDVSNNEMFNINDLSVSVSIVKFLSPESQEDTSDSDLCNLLANSFCDKPLFFSAFPIYKAIIIRLLVFLSATLSIFDRRSFKTFLVFFLLLIHHAFMPQIYAIIRIYANISVLILYFNKCYLLFLIVLNKSRFCIYVTVFCALTVYLHLFLMALKMNLSISFYSQFGFVCAHIEMWEDYLTKCKRVLYAK